MPVPATSPRVYAALLALSTALYGCGTSEAPSAAPRAAAAATPDSIEQMRFVKGYEEGIAEARRQRRPALIIFTAEWCEYCHQMLDEAFHDPAVVSLSDQFVCVLVDADRETLVCSEFRIRAYPTVQFLSPRGVPLNRLTGKQPGQSLYLAMQAALQAVARRTAAEEAARL